MTGGGKRWEAIPQGSERGSRTEAGGDMEGGADGGREAGYCLAHRVAGGAPGGMGDSGEAVWGDKSGQDGGTD